MPKMITGVSLETAIVKRAKAHAKKNRRTFSNYVEGLIIEDLKRLINRPANHKPQKPKLKRRPE